MRKIKIGALIALLLGIVITVFVLSGCSEPTNNVDGTDIDEWVSPDGVHYWYYYSDYRAQLAPRYDNDGNLIIDKEVTS